MSFDEVLRDSPERLWPDAIEQEGRNVYLQAEKLNLEWAEVHDRGGLQQALKAYP